MYFHDINLTAQTKMFLFSVLLGVLLGILFAVLRSIRLIRPRSAKLSFAMDVLFWLLAALLTVLFCLSLNKSTLRGYILLGEFLGWLICYFTVGAVITKFFDTIFNALKRILLFITAPVRFIYRKLKPIFRKGHEKFTKNQKMLLKKPRQLLYNLNGIVSAGKEPGKSEEEKSEETL